MKNRKCNYCKKKGESDKMIHRGIKAFCNLECLTTFAVEQTKTPSFKKRFEKLRNKKAKRLKPKSNRELLKEAQACVNRYVRMRDIYRGYGCISCGQPYLNQKWDAGHYISRRHNFTRFHLWNIHLQCVRCNRYGYGEAISYRINLITRIGEDKVKWLESNYLSLRKYSNDELQRIKKIFSKKSRIMEKRINESS